MYTSEEEQKIVQDSFSHYYVANVSNDSFLERVAYRVCLDQFHCYCYGSKADGMRTIRLFQFIEIGLKGFHVYLYEECKSIWVADLVTLRRDIFCFQDQTSLLRSTFLYDEVEKKLLRLHLLHYFLYLTDEKTHEPVGLVSVTKKKQILRKLDLQREKIEKSIS
jgi:hypothetical protein